MSSSDESIFEVLGVLEDATTTSSESVISFSSINTWLSPGRHEEIESEYHDDSVTSMDGTLHQDDDIFALDEDTSPDRSPWTTSLEADPSPPPPETIPSPRPPDPPPEDLVELPRVSVTEPQRRGSPREDGGPPAKIARTEERADVSERPEREDDGETCSICLDSWGNSGPHRLVCLKCGHLFGYECVVRWLKSLPVKERRCPTCKAKATLRDIRYLYARRLVAVDTTEVVNLKELLETAREERARAEVELIKCQTTVESARAELTRLRTMVQGLKPEPVSSQKQRWHLALEKTLEVFDDPRCRVLAYNSRKYEMFASQRSALNLFPGYGVRKIDCVNLKLGKFIYLHPKPIRDVQYSSHNDMMLSVSLDKTAKQTCCRSEQIVSTIRTDIPLWSCCWHDSSSELVVGGEGGVCLVYDVRNVSAPTHRLAVPQDVSPVIALAASPHGYLAAHLNSCRLYEPVGSEYVPCTLPIEGPFLSLRYDDEFKQVLVSSRPSSSQPRARHTLAALAPAPCRVLHAWRGSRVQTLMARSCQLRLGGRPAVAAHSESERVVELYSGDDFRSLQRLACQEPVVDMAPADVAGETLLATLSSNKVRLYRAMLS